MEKFTWIKWILDSEIWALEEKGLGGWENKDNLGRMKQTPLRRTDNRSCECWNDRIHLKRNTAVKRIDMTISIIRKDWYSHRNMRTPLREGMESTLDIEATRIPPLKTKPRIGLQNKPEQTYDRDFVWSFRGGAYTGSIVQHHHVQGSAHDIRSVPESA